MASTSRDERLRRYWNKHARGYDRDMGRWDRIAFGPSRGWLCAQAAGDVLEVAIGTGLNLPYYPADIRLTGVEWSPPMLAQARRRAQDLGRRVTLLEGDAQALPFPDGSFETVVCTLSLCAIPDDRRAVDEMIRVLRPGGRLLLLDHVAGSSSPVRAVQRLIELVTVPVGGEHFLRRPFDRVQAAGLHIDRHDRFKLGIVERLAARKPAPPPGGLTDDLPSGASTTARPAR